MRNLAEKQRIRAVADRKSYLINELLKLQVDVDIDRPLSDFNLVELENMHINEKCRTENVFAYVYKTGELKRDAAQADDGEAVQETEQCTI